MKFAVAIYNNFEGDLTQEIVEANSDVDALMKCSFVKPYISDYDIEGKTYEELIVEYFNEDIQINVMEVDNVFYQIKEHRSPDGITHTAVELGPVSEPYKIKELGTQLSHKLDVPNEHEISLYLESGAPENFSDVTVEDMQIMFDYFNES